MANPANPNYLLTPQTLKTPVPTTGAVRNAGNFKQTNNVGMFNFYNGLDYQTTIDQVHQQIIPPTINSLQKVDSFSINVNVNNVQTGGATNVPITVQIWEQWKGKIGFMFSTLGLMNLKSILYQFNADLNTFNTGYSSAYSTGYYRADIKPPTSGPKNKERIDEIPQPELAILDLIERVDVKIGKNVLTFENQDMLYMKRRKVHATSCNLDPNEQKAYAHLGSRTAKSCYNGPERTNVALYNIGAAQIPGHDFGQFENTAPQRAYTMGDEYANHFDKACNYQICNPPNVSQPTSVFDAANDLPVNTFFVQTETARQYTLPLWMIIPFFNQKDRYLPPQTQINLEFEFNFYQKNTKPLDWQADEWIVAMDAWYANKKPTGLSTPMWVLSTDSDYENILQAIQNRPTMLGDNVTCQVMPKYTSGLLNSSSFIVLEYFNANEEASNAITRLWNTSPFQYNYFNWKSYPIDNSKIIGQQSIYYNFVQNHNFPLEIYIRPIAYNSSWRGSFQNLSTDTPVQQYTQLSGSFVNSSTTNPNNLYPSLKTITGVFANDIWGNPIPYDPISYLTGTASTGNAFMNGLNYVPIFRQIRVYHQGNLIQDIRNQFLNYEDSLTNVELTNNTHLDILQVGDQVKRSLMFDDNSSAYKITLAPSRHVEPGVYPLDKGATTVTVEIVFNQPWPANYTLEVFSVTPETMTIDNTGNVTVYKWPAFPLDSSMSKQLTLNVN